jgi:type IV pilus assembly protein PilV
MKSLSHSNSETKNNGFTIIEVMVVIGIFAIGILAVASMQVSAFQGNRTAMLRTNAITLATERMENLVSQNYALISADSETVDNLDIIWTVSENTPLTDTKTIVVTVTWNDRGTFQNVNLSHIIAKLD